MEYKEVSREQDPVKYKREEKTQDVSWTPFVWVLALIIFILFIVWWVIPRTMPRNFAPDNPNQSGTRVEPEEAVVEDEPSIVIPDKIDVDVDVEKME